MTGADVGLTVRALGWSLLTPLVLRLPPLRAATLLGAGLSRRRGASPAEVERAVAAVERVRSHLRPVGRGDCLVRTVTLFRLLARRHSDLVLRFGAGAREGSFLAHCWLERDGAPWLDDAEACRSLMVTLSVPANR